MHTNQTEVLTVEEAAAILRIGRNAAYQAVATGALPSARIGRRILIPRVALDRWLAQVGEPRTSTN